MTRPEVSLIVPTCNRRERLETTLSTVSRQTYPAERMEVLVVDDGSTDGTPQLARDLRESGVVYLRQPRGGAAAARNHGAAHARGELLIFVDDDVSLMPDAVVSLVRAQRRRSRTVVVGHLVSPPPENRYQRLQVIPEREAAEGCAEIGCTECFTGLLSIRRAELFEIGHFRDPTGGWPCWDDIDFGYRALRAGLSLVRSSEARGIHYDESSTSLERTARRWEAASEAAVRLFSRYPDLQGSFRLYRDKLPIRWGNDPGLLVARKVLRSLVSSRPGLEIVERVATLAVRGGWPPQVARPLCGCVISGYMWRGLRKGIDTHGPLACDEEWR